MATVQDGSKYFQVDFVSSGDDHGFEIFDQWGEVLEDAGYTPVDFSDGSSVTTSATRASTVQIDNSNAWQRMRAPGGAFEIVWQRGTTERSWRMFFCQDGYNADGTATVLPTEIGTEFQTVGTSGGFDTDWTGSTTSDHRWNMCADSVAGQTGIYYFHMFSHTIATGLIRDRFLFSPFETGTFVVENTAPWILVPGGSGGVVSSSTNCAAHFKRGLAGDAAAAAVQGGSMAATYPSLGVTDAWSGKQNFKRIMFADSSGADEGDYGTALDLFWPASPFGVLPERSTVSLATAWGIVAEGDPGAVFRLGHMLVPWPSTVVPTV